MDHQSAIAYILGRLEKELPATLHYHSLAHTESVMESAQKIAEAEGISEKERTLLLTAAAFHDAGFIRTYRDHEEMSCDFATEHLPRFGFDLHDIKEITYMIMSTKVPQASETHTGRILCDADLDYLGSEGYQETADLLRLELQAIGHEIDDVKWLEIQINFLESHKFWTQYAAENCAAQKGLTLARLKADRLTISAS